MRKVLGELAYILVRY